MANMDGGWNIIIPDGLAKEIGLVCAAVYSVICRFSTRGACYERVDNLALCIGVSASTFRSKIKRLVELGYMEDVTPPSQRQHAYRIIGAKKDGTYHELMMSAGYIKSRERG